MCYSVSCKVIVKITASEKIALHSKKVWPPVIKCNCFVKKHARLSGYNKAEFVKLL